VLPSQICGVSFWANFLFLCGPPPIIQPALQIRYASAFFLDETLRGPLSPRIYAQRVRRIPVVVQSLTCVKIPAVPMHSRVF
jgi:hypothetical protein